MQKVTKAIFPVAGLGTRFLPATKAQPKEMLPLVDKPVIQYAVEEAIAAGIEGLQVDTVTTGAGAFVTKTYQATVSDGQLTVRLKDLGGADVNAPARTRARPCRPRGCGRRPASTGRST